MKTQLFKANGSWFWTYDENWTVYRSNQGFPSREMAIADAAHTRARDACRCHCSNCRPDLHEASQGTLAQLRARK